MYIVFILLSVAAFALGAPGTLPRLDGRIVGGVQTTIQEFPYQLSLQYHGSHICGASIINSRFALTAAHCTVGSSEYSLSVRAGSTTHASGGVVVNVKTIFQHPSYNANNYDYDITVLELERAIDFDQSKQPIALPKLNEVVPPTATSVCTGWGALRENGQSPTHLQRVSLPIISNNDCNNAYGGTITARMMCAGYLNIGGKDACQGDSGGPLIANGKQVGVVSWGYGCASPRYPGVYSSVANLRNFISQNSGV